MRVYLLVAALLVLPLGAEAGLLTFCEGLFSRVVPSKRVFTPEEEARLSKAMNGIELPNLLRVRLADDPMLWLSLEKLPDEVFQILRHLPNDPQKANRILNELDRIMNVPDGSIFRTVQRVRRDESNSDWMERGLARWKQLKQENPTEIARIEKEWSDLANLTRARSTWSQGAGEVSLPMRTSGGQTFIRVGAEEFPAKPYQNGWALEVPRSRVSHPAWNPLESKKLIAIAEKGVPPPKVYETMLGHDGQFYLLDGNHRFEFDSRTTVRVRIPNPPSTGSLHLWFDVINHSQPSDELILKYAEGHAGWRDMMDTRTADRVLIEPSR